MDLFTEEDEGWGHDLSRVDCSWYRGRCSLKRWCHGSESNSVGLRVIKWRRENRCEKGEIQTITLYEDAIMQEEMMSLVNDAGSVERGTPGTPE